MTPSRVETTPEEYGAVGDGVTDDRASIQAAMDFLVSNQGGVLRFAEKTYLIGPGGLNIGANVELRGSEEATVLLAQETETDFWMITGYFATQTVIADLKFDGNQRNRLGNDSFQGAVLLESCQSCRIENCTMVNLGKKVGSSPGALGTAISLRAKEKYPQDSSGNRILNNRIVDPAGNLSFGIRVWTDWGENLPDDGFSRLNKDNVLEGNFIEGTRWNAIEIAGPGSRSNTISSNIVKNTFGHRGVEADKGAIGNRFVENLVDGIIPGAGGAAYAAFCDQGEPGVEGKYPARYARDNTWVGNQARNGDQGNTELPVHGFYCNGSKGISIEGLQVTNFKPNPQAPKIVAGIWVAGVFEDAQIDGCIVRDVPIGIVLGNGHPQRNITISNCELEATHRTLWLAAAKEGLEKDNVAIVDNTVHCDPTVGQYAVLVNAFDRVEMTRNKISGKRVFLGTTFKGHAEIENNTLDNINDHGIYVQQGKANISGNDIKGCANSCIELHAGTSSCVVSDNRLQPEASQNACRDNGQNNTIRLGEA